MKDNHDAGRTVVILWTKETEEAVIIAVDYDGTLLIGGELNLPLIQRIRQSQRKGAVVILWTCREGQRLREAVAELRKAGLIPNLVNDNAPEIVRRLGYNPRKVLADIYIDDKNGGLT